MKEFQVIYIDKDFDDYIVFMNCIEDIYFFETEIYNELSKIKGKEFTVLVDLLLQNGFSFNRFVLLSYYAIDDIKVTIVNPREISYSVKNGVVEYLKSNIELLNSSALSSRMIEYIKNSVMIQENPTSNIFDL
ncbi:MAG: type II toxin-antitoxin system RnlB family antitoxin [Bacilli bacterium]